MKFTIRGLLPFHAAGYHEEADTQRTAIDRVVSSYTPTIKSLVYAREQSVRTAQIDSQNVMLIGMPSTPGESDLPFVTTELAELRKLLGDRVHVRIPPNPSRAILSAFQVQQILHFACHGYTSVQDPSQSRLLLTDWQTSALTASDIAALPISKSQFAFLSACHSARIQDFRLLDEAITLATAVQIAGFPSVIGTLWEVSDKFSPFVAKTVYQCMLEATDKLDPRLWAYGLHRAVRQLREITSSVPGVSRRIAPRCNAP